MGKVLVYSDNVDLAMELCSFSSGPSEDITALVFDGEAAEKLSVSAAKSLIQVQGPSDIPETYARPLAEMVEQRGYDLVLIGATARGRDLASQLAGYLSCGAGNDVKDIAMDSVSVSFERMTYGGNVISHEKVSGRAVLTVGRGTYEKKNGTPTSAEKVTLEPDARLSLVSREPIKSEGVDIASADHVVGIGMGLTDQTELRLAEDLAAAMKGAIACSRGISEERGWLPVERYIGISGKVIAPQVYLTLGISGQVQHLYGVRDAKVIVAIDKNENSSICRNADYYVVGDLKEYAPLLTKAIRDLG